MNLYFWQVIISPHMTELVSKMTMYGYSVYYIAIQAMSSEREALGWEAIFPHGVEVIIAESTAHLQSIVVNAEPDSIHVVGGVRGNGNLGLAQKLLINRGLRQWIIMETVDDYGLQGFVKRILYRLIFFRFRSILEGVLAIGYRTPKWCAAVGVPKDRIYPFAYFLPETDQSRQLLRRPTSERFRFIYVGQLVERKRLLLLMEALRDVCVEDIDLYIVGCGPLDESLRAKAAFLLPGRYHWLGRLTMIAARIEIHQADCLVLPSRHDGWGAVVSEALMCGTPVVCSDTCGAAGVVQLSGYGGVFRSGDQSNLRDTLQQVVAAGKLSPQARVDLVEWSRCLSAEAGASYLHRIFEYTDGKAKRPSPPWSDSAVS